MEYIKKLTLFIYLGIFMEVYSELIKNPKKTSN